MILSTLEDFNKKLTATGDLGRVELEENLAEIQDSVKIDPNSGFVRLIDKDNYSDKVKIQLIVISRLLYNQLQIHLKNETTVSASVSIDELENMLKINRRTLTNRIGELRDSGQLVDSGKGSVKATPHTIKSFLKGLKKGKKE